MRIEGVIFDLDGVVIDSEGYSRKPTKQIFSELNKPYDDDLFKAMLGITNQDCEKILTEKFNDSKQAAFFMNRFEELMAEAYKEGKVPLKKGALEIVDFLNANSIPYALATSSSALKVSRVFGKTPFGHNPFNHMITAEMVEIGKPNPEVFLKAAASINVDIKNCLIIEDSYNGIEAGYRAKGIVVMVVDLIAVTDKIKTMTNYIFDDLLQVIDLLKQNLD